MPVVITFDSADYAGSDHTRIRTAFERLGWQNLGGSAYRYPRLGTDDQPVEVRMNHVIPALMLFRSFILDRVSRSELHSRWLSMSSPQRVTSKKARSGFLQPKLLMPTM